MTEPLASIQAAQSLGVADLLRKQVTARPASIALEDSQGTLSYRELDARVNRAAQLLAARGVKAGKRITVLSENRREYIELELAAAKLGAIVACLNWRLADAEMLHCIRVVEPRIVFVSARYAAVLSRIDHGVADAIDLDTQYEALLAAAPDSDPRIDVDPEQGLVILYTSGTTGLPKGALISQRAMVARAMCFSSEYGIGASHNYIAWSPLFHMAGTEFSLTTLMLGGKVIVQDGLDVDRLCATLARAHRLVSGDAGNDRPADRRPAPQCHTNARRESGRRDGRPGAAAADRRAHAIAERALPQQLRRHRNRPRAGFRQPARAGRGADELGQTRIGLLPAAPGGRRRSGCAHRHPRRSRAARADIVLRLLERTANQHARVSRRLERVLLALPAVADAAVVRQRDDRWGEVPVAFVALKPGAMLDAATLHARCREQLAGYKIPKAFHFVDVATFPRSSTGKIQRHEIERLWLG